MAGRPAAAPTSVAMRPASPVPPVAACCRVPSSPRSRRPSPPSCWPRLIRHQPEEDSLARSRSGTRGRRGPRKPPRRDGAFAGAVQVAEPRERGAVELPGTITVKDLAELLGVNPADVIRELIKSGIFATINQLIDRDTASVVASELGYEVAEPLAADAGSPNGEDGATEARPEAAAKEELFTEDDPADLVPRA